MTTIKGPINIKGGFNAREFLKEKAGDIKMKLPFSATGWKSAKNSDLVTGKKEVAVSKKNKVIKK